MAMRESHVRLAEAEQKFLALHIAYREFTFYSPWSYEEKNFLIVFTLCYSTENARNHFNGIGALPFSCICLYDHGR